jgi:hypothetical protein
MLDKNMLKYLTLQPDVTPTVENMMENISVTGLASNRDGKNPYTNSYESNGFGTTPNFVLKEGTEYSMAYQVLISYITQVMYITHLLVCGAIDERKVIDKRNETAIRASTALNSLLSAK